MELSQSARNWLRNRQQERGKYPTKSCKFSKVIEEIVAFAEEHAIAFILEIVLSGIRNNLLQKRVCKFDLHLVIVMNQKYKLLTI